MPVDVSPATVAALGGAAFLVGLSKGGLGGGLGPLITILVALVTSPTRAIGILLPILMVGDAVALWALRGRWDRGIIVAMLPGAVLGIAAASAFLGAVDDRAVEVVLALLSLLFVVYRLAEPRLLASPPVPGRRGALVAGLASGVTSTVAHAGGPPVAAYLLAARVEPVTFVASSAAFFFVVNWLKVPGYVAAGLLDASVVRLVPLAVFLVPGVVVGRLLVDRVDRRRFERIVLTLLVVGALYLLFG